ncbi:MAG: tetratricopeptide repeat protein, partial [Tepidisphaeraceae bacterium]
MDIRSVSWRLLAFLFLAMAGYAARGADAPREITDGEKALAIRFADLTQSLVRSGTPDENQFRRVAALLAAARQCDPEEPRYARLHADVLIQLHDADGAIDALGAVRRLRPEDRIAQIETIDMFLARMQTADARLAYLQDLVVRDAVPREVRSHVALRIAALQEEKSRHNDAMEAIDLAIKLNPLNFTALQIKFSLIWDAVTQNAAAPNPVPRVTMLVALVRANPARPDVLHLLGRHFAAAGMSNESLIWFTHAVNVASQARAGLTLEMMIDFATASFFCDRLDQAQQAFDQILKFNPADYPSLISRSMIELRRDKPESARDFRIQARNSLINQLNAVRNQMGIQGATTRPIDQGEVFMPEIGSDTDAYRKQDKPRLKGAYLRAAVDLAWFQVFYNDQPDEAQRLMRHAESLMDAKEQAAVTDLPVIAGWVYLKQGKIDEARVKFSAVADREPMAALGLIKCYGPAEKDKARTEAQKLVNANPAGVQGAVILDKLREFGVRAQPSENAPAMTAAKNTLPQNWMDVLDDKRTASFYAIRGQPLRISSPFGEPLIAQVVIQNTSDVDLSVGPDGLIKPGVWFDAVVGGIFQQNIPAVAVE